MHPKTEWLHVELALHLDMVRTYFKDEVRLTLLVRNPEHEKRDVIITDDNEEELLSRLDGFLDLD